MNINFLIGFLSKYDGERHRNKYYGKIARHVVVGVCLSLCFSTVISIKLVGVSYC